MKKKISIITAIVMLVAATAFAAPSDQTGTGNQSGFEQMYQYCNQVMQQWGNGNQATQGVQAQGQPMSYNGGMMMGGMMNGMMGGGNYGNMMGGMMGNGTYGNMMGSLEVR
ncbi:MAG: hypothetical protein RIN56_18900 [Sporomusaceae bacterium]|nr:hypothetical protein [Sporomusaceae bacterium]